jgi:hypothetical protein
MALRPIKPRLPPTSPDKTMDPPPLLVDPHCYTPGEYSSEENSSTSSLDSTTTRHISENGRRYHGFRQGRYLLPNDKTEQGRSFPFYGVRGGY